MASPEQREQLSGLDIDDLWQRAEAAAVDLSLSKVELAASVHLALVTTTPARGLRG